MRSLGDLSKSALRKGYNRTIRPLLPAKIVSWSGIPVQSGRLLDSSDVRFHKTELMNAIRESVEAGDDVVEIGSGNGVCTALILQQGASVEGYEGGKDKIDTATKTVRLTTLADRCELNHAIVGTANIIYGDTSGASTLHPKEIPKSDVLVLDCEGSEIGILRECKKASTVIVETHPEFNAPATMTETILREQGYVVERRSIKKKDGHVLIANFRG